MPDAINSASQPAGQNGVTSSCLALKLELRHAAHGRRIAIATLDAPATLHALTLEMIRALDAALRAWADDPAVVCVVLQSSTEKAFCAGGDVRSLRQAILDEAFALPNRRAQAFFSEEYRLDYLIHTYAKPVVAWGAGIVMGGGLGLLAGASHRVVTPHTRIAMPEITIGLFPDVGGSWFLPRMPGRCGLFLGLTGAPLNAHDALFAGLADYFLAQEQRTVLLDALCAAPWPATEDEKSGSVDSKAHRLLDHLLRELSLPPAQLPCSELRQHFDTITTLCAARDLHQVTKAIGAYDGAAPWLQRAAQSLQKGAPSSQALVWQLQQRARHLSLAQVFQLELTVALQCCAHPDFAEGVRALLVEKDNAPQWQQPDANAGKQQDAHIDVDGFFAAPWPQHPLADLA